jgi:MSHA type pilus biogenesis protein MshL
MMIFFVLFLFVPLVLFLLLCGCQSIPHQSIHPSVESQSWKKMIQSAPITPRINKNLTKKKSPDKPTPTLDSKWNQKISVYTTNELPIGKIYKQLAQSLGLTLEFCSIPKDNHLELSINDQPFIQAIQTLCRLCEWRYEIINSKTIIITPDVAYHKSYEVQFLNLLRQSHSVTTSNNDLSSTHQGKNDSGFGSNVSTSQITNRTSNDFWEELKNNLEVLLDGHKFTIHKQAGLISIIAPHRQQKEVESYLKQLKKVSTTQVLIEAKIIEVHLKEEFKSGINWQTINKNKNFLAQGNFGSTTHPTNMGSSSLEIMSMGGSYRNFQTVIQALEAFGSVRTLSNPRLSIMNNQSGILKVAQNQVYFKLNYDKHYGTLSNTESVNVSSSIQTIPIGLVLNVQPAVDFDQEEIILFLRPTISKLSNSVADPAVEIALAKENSTNANNHQQSLVPVVEVREIESILRIKNNDLAIVGGLMEIKSQNSHHHIPGTNNIPIVQDLTGAKANHDSVVELVILLHVTIIDDDSSPKASAMDSYLANELIYDPRKNQ